MKKNMTKAERRAKNRAARREYMEKNQKRRWTIVEKLDHIKFAFCFIPKQNWGVKISTLVGDSKWREISKTYRQKQNYTCEYCGEYHPEPYGTDCHEVWGWNNIDMIQDLCELKCVCKRCHSIAHPGFAARQGMETEEIVATYARLNDLSFDDAERILTELYYINEWLCTLGKFELNKDAIAEVVEEQTGIKLFNTITF